MHRGIADFAALWVIAMAMGQELHHGVWAGRDLNAFPLPVSGYEVYLVGELHGVKENEAILMQYVERLAAGSGLRDVAIEEDAVYQNEARAYVEGSSMALPEELCLRAGVLGAIRRFNEERNTKERIRVHLVDIDSPAAAIRRHLMAIQRLIGGAAAKSVPDAPGIRKRGLETVDRLQRLTTDQQLLGELRTVRHSIRAYKQGLEVGTARFKGSPYLDDREEAITSNILDLVRKRDCRGVLALYGSDHVSKAVRKDGGAKRDGEFAPLALRLEKAGVKVFSLVTFPLAGRSRWRGRESELPWTAGDGRLENGETLDRAVAATGEGTMLYVDPRWHKVRLPSQDVTAFQVDAFLLFPHAAAMEDRCAGR